MKIHEVLETIRRLEDTGIIKPKQYELQTPWARPIRECEKWPYLRYREGKKYP